MVIHKTITFLTSGLNDVIDITNQVQALVSRELKKGLVNIFIPGATGGITTIEYEPGLIKDIKKFFEEIIPFKKDYAHHNTWHDDNGASHLRASLLGPSLTIPVENGKLVLGTWQ